MKPLYKFTLDKETFEISVSEVGWHYCYVKDVDTFKNYHVYSFNPDINHAKDIMIEAISQRLIKAQTEVERWAKAFKEIHI